MFLGSSGVLDLDGYSVSTQVTQYMCQRFIQNADLSSRPSLRNLSPE